MTGKQQVLQRLGKMGYATIHLDFSQFAKTVEKEYTFENLSDEKKHTLFQNWVKYCENQFKNVSPTSVKADHLFVTASPIIPLLYMSEKMDTRLDQDAKTAIQEWDKVFGKVRYFLSEADSIESAYRLSGDQYAFEHHINQYAPEKQQLAREVLERFNFVQMNRVFGGSAMINKSEKDIVEYCTARYRKLFAQYLNMHESAHSSVISQQATKDSDVKQMVKDSLDPCSQ